MTAQTPRTTDPLEAAATPDSILGRILVGVDDTEPSFEACRQLAQLAESRATIDAVTVVHLGPAVAAALDAARLADSIEREAEIALDRAASILGARARTRYADGFIVPILLDEAERIGAGLLAVGSHGHSRTAEILLGGVAGEILHKAPCSVLVAKGTARDGFPRRLLVGHDGSDHADGALALARRLAERHGASVRVVTALRGNEVDLERVHGTAPDAEAIDAQPVEALVDAAADADLVVVGSRGLHGFQALGSVSERVAHRAGCSVLVVR